MTFENLEIRNKNEVWDLDTETMIGHLQDLLEEEESPTPSPSSAKEEEGEENESPIPPTVSEESEDGEDEEEGEEIEIPASPEPEDIDYGEHTRVDFGEELSRRNIFDVRNYVRFNYQEKALKKITQKQQEEFNQAILDRKQRYDNLYDSCVNDLAPDVWAKNKLKSILKDNETKREIGNKEYGLIDLKKIHRIVTTGKIFKRKALMTDKKYSMVLLVDCSGSMNPDKSVNAAKATIKFLQEYSEYIDIEVRGFNMLNIPLKSFGEKITKKMLKEIFFLIIECAKGDARYIRRIFEESINYEGANGNHDHIHLQDAEQRLRKKMVRSLYLFSQMADLHVIAIVLHVEAVICLKICLTLLKK